MSTVVSNVSGDRNDKIANAAKVLGKSKIRKAVFIAVYTNKRKEKTVQDIMLLAGIKSNIRVLQEAQKLVAEDMIKVNRTKGQATKYEKIDFYTHNKAKILQLANSRKKLASYPTKTNPQSQSSLIKIHFPKSRVNFSEITVDDIDSFSKIRKIKIAKAIVHPIAENKIKNGIQKIIGDKGKFTDWGGETNDLFTSRVFFKRKRISAAFAFKGKGTKGNLTPGKLGKNGDQIQRLFKSAAEMFIIQYQGQIDQSVVEQMKTHAISKSYTEGIRIYYGIIDGQDTARLMKAYSQSFK